MEHKHIQDMSDREQQELAQQYTRGPEQAQWERKELGTDPAHAEKSSLHLKPAKLTSIRIPPDVLTDLKEIAHAEGFKYQTYIVALLKRHVKEKKSA
ncbi:MAG: hypothetical protein OXT67_02330 [Zetaproteobacteria bacterium]|nr:hypothetical protein [Zetaproteobacteria bacterium]